jgi:hypothetical protein
MPQGDARRTREQPDWIERLPTAFGQGFENREGLNQPARGWSAQPHSLARTGVIIALSLASVTQRISSLSKMDLRRGSIVVCAARSQSAVRLQSAAFSQGFASRNLICSVNQAGGTEIHPKEQGSRKIATQLARTTFRQLV